jgi:DNA mismatch repair protein MutL
VGYISELDTDLINKIAAGEVIESAHSVVKELIENSIDAKSTRIQIETFSAGIEKILISDNGSGILEEDLPLSIKRHATSKIKNAEDLETVLSFGFRGEALASIASVSNMKIITGTSNSEKSIEIVSQNESILEKKYAAPFKGTSIEVSDLFYNTPVRRKFLKSERAEDKKIKDRISTIALAYPDIEFAYMQDGKKVFSLKAESHKERIVSLFGMNFENHLLEVQAEKKGLSAFGFISDTEFYRSNRSGQYIFLNNRPIEIKYSSYLLKKCYDELIPTNSHPWCFLFFTIDPKLIDVNVHPTKKEVRFLDEEGFNSFFISLINSELYSKKPVGILEMSKRFFFKPSVNPSFKQSEFIPRAEEPILGNQLYSEVQTQTGFDLNRVGAGSRLETLNENIETKKREFVPKKHFGVIFETFILAEAEDGIYIIDQHTAHERIRYEEILRELKNKKSTQTLLTPIRIDLSNEDAELALSKKEEYSRVGIELDYLGSGTLLVREVPSFIESGKEKEIIIDLLNRTKGEEQLEKQIYDLMAKCVACRSAIKKGDLLSDAILGEILNRLSYCENPSRCPHGRPTLIKLTRDDLEKMFHRK